MEFPKIAYWLKNRFKARKSYFGSNLNYLKKLLRLKVEKNYDSNSKEFKKQFEPNLHMVGVY